MSKKPRLNWFSPLPPARTGIADYSRALLDDLDRFWDILLWADAPEAEVDDHEVRNFDPLATALPWFDLNTAHATIYHIGNNAKHHSGTWNVLRRHPGILILHEVFLADFVGQASTRPDFAEILSLVERHFGSTAGQELVAAIDANDVQSINERFPLSKLLVDQASAVVVHARGAFDEIKEFTARPAIHLDLPHISEKISRPRDGQLGVHSFVMLGHIGRNRLLHPVLEALAHFRGRKDWRFDIYGEIDEEPAVRLAIEDLDLGTAVSVHGFTSQADLRDALTRADLAFNLRSPTLGEASYSQLTLWNYSVPTIVCDIGWYADLPRAAVYAIDPRRAVPDLARAIAAFFAEPARFAEIGRYGKQALEERHGPRRYVDRLTEFINEVNGSSGSLHAAESMARAVGHGWRGLHLPWPAQARMRDRCAGVVCELAGRFD